MWIPMLRKKQENTPKNAKKQPTTENQKDTKSGFFKENVGYPVWTCRDPISMILATRLSLILGTR